MTEPLLSGWPIEINGRFPTQLILGETPPRPKKTPPPPTFIEISPGNLRLLPRPSLDLQFWATKSLVDATTGTNLVDFTRASSGTYVGSDGLIKTATTNLLLRSEEFETWWVAQRASVSSNATIAPNGTPTADEIIEDATATNTHRIYSGGVQSAGTYTITVHAKASARSHLYIAQESGGNSVFTLTGAGTAVALGANTVSITNVGDGWYRCASTYTATGNHFIYLSVHNGTSHVYTGDGTSGIYIWGAQLEQSSTVGEYVKTTSTINSAPRFDHDPTTGESLGLLVEESRTNLLLQSEDFSTTWNTTNDITVSTNQTVAPDGNLTGDLIAADATNATHNIFQDAAVGSGSYTFSCYIKANGYTTGALRTGLSGNFVNGDFDLTAGTISISTSGTAINGTGDLIDIGNGWFRCWISASNIGSGSTTRNVVYLNGTSSFLGDGTSGLYIWGAQLEEGSFPTSYIPTEGTTVTRAADVASISGSNFSSWYRQDEGTVFAEANGSGPLITPRATASPGDRIQLAFGSSAVVVSGSVEATFNNTTAAKRLLAYKANNTNAAFDGVTGVNDTSCTIPSVDYATIGYFDFGGALRNNGAIKRITFWPQRLPDPTLSTITQ